MSLQVSRTGASSRQTDTPQACASLFLVVRFATTGFVQTLASTISGRSDPFEPTQWTLICAAADNEADAAASAAALTQLCESYWAPLYTYVRGRGYPRPDAQDLTQSFFAYLVQRRIYARADRRNGKFRAFLLASLKHFLSDARDHAGALKRGGGYVFIPLDESSIAMVESMFQTRRAPEEAMAEDRLFERNWAKALVGRALAQLAANYQAEEKEALFEELSPFLAGQAGPLPSYAELASRLAIKESTVRSHVTRLRARYRELLRREVRRTVSSGSEVDDELRELLRVLANG